MFERCNAWLRLKREDGEAVALPKFVGSCGDPLESGTVPENLGSIESAWLFRSRRHCSAVDRTASNKPAEEA